jgi:hypothetical protein
MAPVAASPAPVPASPAPAPVKDKAAARKRFEAVYTTVRDELLADFRKHNMPEESIAYYQRVCSSPSLSHLVALFSYPSPRP